MIDTTWSFTPSVIFHPSYFFSHNNPILQRSRFIIIRLKIQPSFFKTPSSFSSFMLYLEHQRFFSTIYYMILIINFWTRIYTPVCWCVSSDFFFIEILLLFFFFHFLITQKLPRKFFFGERVSEKKPCEFEVRKSWVGLWQNLPFG